MYDLKPKQKIRVTYLVGHEHRTVVNEGTFLEETATTLHMRDARPTLGVLARTTVYKENIVKVEAL